MDENQKKLVIDLGVFLLFLIVSSPKATGVVFHEWISFAFIPVIILHLLMSWKWIVDIMTRFLKKIPGETRFNSLWVTILFIMMTLVIFTGIIISEVALTSMGIPIVADLFCFAIQDIRSNLFLLLLGIHLAMHCDWVIKGFKCYILPKPIQQKVNFRQRDQ
jgi:hypothetical protein